MEIEAIKVACGFCELTLFESDTGLEVMRYDLSEKKVLARVAFKQEAPVIHTLYKLEAHEDHELRTAARWMRRALQFRDRSEVITIEIDPPVPEGGMHQSMDDVTQQDE